MAVLENKRRNFICLAKNDQFIILKIPFQSRKFTVSLQIVKQMFQLNFGHQFMAIRSIEYKHTLCWKQSWDTNEMKNEKILRSSWKSHESKESPCTVVPNLCWSAATRLNSYLKVVNLKIGLLARSLTKYSYSIILHLVTAFQGSAILKVWVSLTGSWIIYLPEKCPMDKSAW